MATKKWSQEVTEHSDALDLEPGVFTWKDPEKIARSLKKSADASKRRKSEPYHAAISVLTFYINRGGRSLDASQKVILEQAKAHVRKLYGVEEQ